MFLPSVALLLTGRNRYSAADKLDAQLPLETLWVLASGTDASMSSTYTFLAPERRLMNAYAENSAVMDAFAAKCDAAVKAWYVQPISA